MVSLCTEIFFSRESNFTSASGSSRGPEVRDSLHLRVPNPLSSFVRPLAATPNAVPILVTVRRLPSVRGERWVVVGTAKSNFQLRSGSYGVAAPCASRVY